MRAERGGRLAVLLAVAWAAVAGVRAHVPAEPWPATHERGTILVLIPVQPGRALFNVFARGVAAEFLRADAPPVTLSFEQLYDVLDSEAVTERQLAFVRAKYQGQRIDAIIALAQPRYLQVRERLDLSPRTPLVFIAEQVTRYARPRDAAFIDVTDTLVDSWAFMRPLFAPGHQVAVLGGSAPADRLIAGATLASLRGRIGEGRVIDLTNLSLTEMPARVARLPPDAVLLMDSTVSDRTGRPITSRGVLAAIRPSLHVPTLVSNDALLGQGVLGGSLYRIEDLGVQAARLALRVLDGVAPDALPVQRLAATPVIDARELARLGIPESRVPAGTTLLWRAPGMWEQYRSWILAGATVVLLQGALIAGLLAERRRRLASQRQLAERLRVQALVADISTEFANLPGGRLDAQIARSLEHLGYALGTDDCAIWALRGRDDQPRRVSGSPQESGTPRAESLAEEALLTWARPRLERGEEVQIADSGTPPPAAGADHVHRPPRRGSVLLLPLRVDGEVVGVFSLRHASSQDWSAQVLGDLRTIGEIIATAWVRKRTDASMRQQIETLAHVDRVASLGQLAASIAHELNQPLAAILSNAEVAQHLLASQDPPIDELRAIVAGVIADDERAAGIIRNMRSMLRRHDIAATALDVNVIATEITRLAAHDARLRGVSLDIEIGAGVPAVTIDATQLTQVLLNLVVNGVDAMEAIGVRLPVSLRTRAGDGGAVIEVRDHGPGLTADVMLRLFDPFFTTKAEGLGVGLSISRSIVESAGGRIWAENAPDGGARFVVWLPKAAAPAVPDREPGRGTRTAPA